MDWCLYDRDLCHERGKGQLLHNCLNRASVNSCFWKVIITFPVITVQKSSTEWLPLKLLQPVCNFTEKDTPSQLYYCDRHKIYHNNIFTEHLRAGAFAFHSEI